MNNARHTHTRTLKGQDARHRLIAGVTSVAEPVGSTMGPCGLTVLIRDSDGKTISTKDGVTVSAAVAPEHPVERMGAELIQAAARKTADVAGDGTTTCTVMAAAMLAQAEKAIAANFSQTQLRRELPIAMTAFLNALKATALPCSSREQLERVALVASNGDATLSSVAVDAVVAAGATGKIHIETTDVGHTHVTISDGIITRAEILSAHFANVTGKLACAGDSSIVVISRGRLQSFDLIMPALQEAQRKKIALLLLFSDYDQAAMQALVNNRSKAGVNVFACKLVRPTYDEVADFATCCGATPADADSAEPAKWGHLNRFYADKAGLSVVPADRSLALTLASELAAKAGDSPDARDRAAIASRLVAIAAKHAIIRIVAPTQAESTEIRHRAEDAVAAARAALEHGIVAGGGTAALSALKATDLSCVDRQVAEVITAAAEAPARQILRNAGKSFDWFCYARSTDASVYDAARDVMLDSSDSIIDSALSVTSAFENASSVVRTFVALSSIIYEETVN